MNCIICDQDAQWKGERCPSCLTTENATLRVLVAHMIMSIETAQPKQIQGDIVYTQQYGQAFLDHLKMALAGVKGQNESYQKTFTLPFSRYSGGYLQIIMAFSHKMYAELAANDCQKGNFLTWKPSASDAISELHHHTGKLKAILESPSPPVQPRVTEYCADIANTVMGIERTLGISHGHHVSTV